MTHRERVLAALRHEETDRPPIDLGAMRSTGIMAIAYNRLKAHLGFPVSNDTRSPWCTRVYDVVQQLAEPDLGVLDLFDADVLDLSRAFLVGSEDWQPWTLPDGSAARMPAWVSVRPDGSGGWDFLGDDGTVIGRMPRGVEYVNQACHPLEDARTPEDLADLAQARSRVSWFALGCAPWHRPLDDSKHFASVREAARRLHDTTDRAVMAALGGNILEAGQFLRGFGRFLEDLAADTRMAEALMDRLVEDYLGIIPRFFEAVGDCVHIVQMGDDLGTQLAAQVSPEMYRRLIKPRHRVVYEAVRKHFGGYIFLHSCGAISELIPDLIDVGVQVINPVQTSCPGMEPARLKREFGADLTFWGGGCETQTVLRRAGASEVRRHVRDRVRVFGEGGGFVFCQVHNIMSDVPPENVAAMYEAVHEARL